MNKRWLIRFPWHPYLLLGLYGLIHVQEALFDFEWGKAGLLFALGLLVLRGAFWLLHVIYKQKEKAALLLSILAGISLFYTGLYAYGAWLWPGFRHRYLLLGLGLLIVGIVWRLRNSRPPLRFTQYLNLLLGLLILWEGIQLGVAFQAAQNWWTKAQAEIQATPHPGIPTQSPSVFHVVLDAHTSWQSLERYWGYRDTILAPFLEQKGFFMARQARSSYWGTMGAMASIFHTRYTPEWEVLSGSEVRGEGLGRRAIRAAPIFSAWQQAGHQLINLSPFDIGDQPLFYDIPFLQHPHNSSLHLSHLTIWGSLISGPRRMQTYRAHGRMLDSLDRISPGPQAYWVYAHFCLPHAPFYFDQEGIFYPRGRSGLPRKQAYLEQLVYSDKLMVERLEKLLQRWGAEVVIILESDHGWRHLDQPEESHSNLFALYLPGQDYTGLSDSINVVNTYRILQEKVWGQPTLLLEHRAARDKPISP